MIFLFPKNVHLFVKLTELHGQTPTDKKSHI